MRFMFAPSIRMRENRFYEIVEHFGFGLHPAARVGVHVPAPQLVQRRGFLIREVQDIAVAAFRRVALSNTFLRTSGRCRAPRTASYCARVSVRSMTPLPSSRRGEISSAHLSRKDPMPRTNSSPPDSRSRPRRQQRRSLTHHDTSDEWITSAPGSVASFGLRRGLSRTPAVPAAPASRPLNPVRVRIPERWVIHSSRVSMMRENRRC